MVGAVVAIAPDPGLTMNAIVGVGSVPGVSGTGVRVGLLVGVRVLCASGSAEALVRDNIAAKIAATMT